jgi:hypothetical protein
MKKNLYIVEGTQGTWHYHLSETGKSGQPSLCGNRDVMCTEASATLWGYRGHLKETYCHVCEEIAKFRFKFNKVK